MRFSQFIHNVAKRNGLVDNCVKFYEKRYNITTEEALEKMVYYLVEDNATLYSNLKREKELNERSHN